MLGLKLNKYNCHTTWKFVGHGSETQLQVGENFNYLIQPFNIINIKFDITSTDDNKQMMFMIFIHIILHNLIIKGSFFARERLYLCLLLFPSFTRLPRRVKNLLLLNSVCKKQRITFKNIGKYRGLD